MIAYRIVPFLLAGLVAAKDHGKAEVFAEENYGGTVQKVAFNKGCITLDFKPKSFRVPAESYAACAAYIDEYCEHKNGYWSKNETTIEQTIHSLNCVVV